jgi:hypothetical protein
VVWDEEDAIDISQIRIIHHHCRGDQCRLRQPELALASMESLEILIFVEE